MKILSIFAINNWATLRGFTVISNRSSCVFSATSEPLVCLCVAVVATQCSSACCCEDKSTIAVGL